MPKATKKEPEEPGSAPRDVKKLFYRKLTESHVFFEVGKIIASELEPLELIQKITDVVKKTVHFRDAVVYTMRKDMTGLDPFFSSGPLFKNVALEPIYLDNTCHPVNQRLGLAKADKSHIHAFGIDWDDASGTRNGHFAPFSWAA